MPLRKDIKNILVIGSGPIIIGQASEFDYSGTQACKSLKEEGYRVVLLNSNPASVMTDPDISDATYIEPMTMEVIEKIIIKEKIDAYLPTVGGQIALNFAMELFYSGLDKKHKFQIIGANPHSIEIAEDRQKFKKTLYENEIKTAAGFCTSSYDLALQNIQSMSFPLILRSSFTLGGKGSGIAHNTDEFHNIFHACLEISKNGEVSVEAYLSGWKEFEMEVVRDSQDNCIVVCAIENINPMGVHTGDSITVAPTMTLTDKEYQKMRTLAFKVMRVVGADTGGANVQFALDPYTGNIVVIEMNPRVSRSSALASKATGFPIASVAAKIAVGMTLDEIKNNVINKTAAFEPTLDYVVVKIPRFDLEKFPGVSLNLGSSMKSVGEVMAIARSFPQALQKAIRSLGKGYAGLSLNTFSLDCAAISKEELTERLQKATPEQIFYVAEALRQNFDIEYIYAITKWDKWFLAQIKEIIDAEEHLVTQGINYLEKNLAYYKFLGFSDIRLAELLDVSTEVVLGLRVRHSIYPIYSRVDSCAAEYSSHTNYLYSTYLMNRSEFSICESGLIKEKSIIIIGSGPNSIGQGIEFDYSCVQASAAVKNCGYQSIIINCNPETVSTDSEVSNKLYFAPLFSEDVIDIITKEKLADNLAGIIVCYGGQTAINLAKNIKNVASILGTDIDGINLAEDRKAFYDMLDELHISHPKSIDLPLIEIMQIGQKLSWPIIVRPSYVIGGKAIAKLSNDQELAHYVNTNMSILDSLLAEEFVENAIEIEIDAIFDGTDLYVAGIIEHLDKAGVHSGDSMCVLPFFSVDSSIIDLAIKYARKIASALKIIGLFNVQFLVKNSILYVIEVNPRASRTIPFIIKSTGVPIVEIATKILLGSKLSNFGLDNKTCKINGYAIKKPVFSNKILGCEVQLGPEMCSTGEEMFFTEDLNELFIKAGMKEPEANERSNQIYSLQSLKKRFLYDI